jgi:flagellar biosynthesis GTPase FlhF
MIDNYLQAVHAKSNYFKLRSYNGEHDKARAAFVKCCKSIVSNWKDNNEEITDQLVKYCIQQDFNGQLDKGILLMGNTGVGKTVYLKALSLMLGYLNNFKFNT